MFDDDYQDWIELEGERFPVLNELKLEYCFCGINRIWDGFNK